MICCRHVATSANLYVPEWAVLTFDQMFIHLQMIRINMFCNMRAIGRRGNGMLFTTKNLNYIAGEWTANIANDFDTLQSYKNDIQKQFSCIIIVKKAIKC